MSSYTFYRKYRPKKFADIVGQGAVVKTLKSALEQERISHAYLFTGPRGTGKTTLARLFAQALNCSKRKGAEPCGKCPHCLLQAEGRSLDIFEIDAASHTGVDNIRELRETVNLSPTLGAYKVYIIDEAHMLSVGAWNALLKTLEEPPAHVVFILATTNVGKVPETILSRAMRFDLTEFPVDEIMSKLKKIAKAEKITIDDEALLIIARAAHGGMRDAEMLFTQIATLEESPIDGKRVALLLGVTDRQALGKLLTFVVADDFANGLIFLRDLKSAGINFIPFLNNLLEYLRSILFFSVDAKQASVLTTDMTEEEQEVARALATKLGSHRIIECLERFQEASINMKETPILELPIEIALAKLIHTQSNSGTTSVTPPTPPAGNAPSSKPPEKITQPSQSSLTIKKSVALEYTMKTPNEGAAFTRETREEPKRMFKDKIEEPEQALVKALPVPDFSLIKNRWSQIVAEAKAINASVGVALSAATPTTVHGNKLVLTVKYPFHKERLDAKQHRLTLGRAFDTILGLQIGWVVEVEGKTTSNEPRESHPPIIDQALEILGGRLAQES